jgi:CheY-like chemotaxis protein
LEAIEVSDGKETLAMIERDRLNLEITDIRMPKMKASVCWGICTANFRSYQ